MSGDASICDNVTYKHGGINEKHKCRLLTYENLFLEIYWKVYCCSYIGTAEAIIGLKRAK